MGESGVSYTTWVISSPPVGCLDSFLKPYIIPSGSKFSNIVNQAGLPYYVPTSTRGGGQAAGDLELDQRFARPIDQLFHLLEEVRRHGIILNFCEQQWHYEPIRITRPGSRTALERVADQVFDKKKDTKLLEQRPTFEDDLPEAELSDEELATTDSIADKSLKVDLLSKEELQQVYTPEQLRTSFQQTDHVGIWLDFDILQKESTRKLSDEQYVHIIQGVCGILRESLDFASCRNPTGVVEKGRHGLECKVYVILLRKKDVRPEKHHKYGSCYKDSFHLRIPTVMVTRGYKAYLRKRIYQSDFLVHALSGLGLVNTYEEIVDAGAVVSAPMLLGSCKVRGREAHAIYKLYTATIRLNDAMPLVTPSKEFDPIEEVQNGTPVAAKKTIRKTAVVLPRYRWNLTYEASLLYENPDGLIKKRHFEAKPELFLELKSLEEREAPGLTASADIDAVDRAVADLCRLNPEARFINDCLALIDVEKAERFSSWKSIVLILARENPDYKPLAIRFSQRSPTQWSLNGGNVAFEKMWNWGVNNPTKLNKDLFDNPEEELQRRNIRTIYNWAATDDPEGYRKCRGNSAYHRFFELANQYEGNLNETHIADVLECIFGGKFVTDKVVKNGTRQERVWYSFCMPDKKVQSHRSMYKWKCEYNMPDTFDTCISRIFPEYIAKIINHFKEQESKPDNDEKLLKHYQNTISGLTKLTYKLGNQATINKYINRAAVIFQRDDFIENLDRCERVIGTTNGVLVLYPKTELVQAYNDYNITRSVTVDFIPHEPGNPYKTAIKVMMREIFVEKDAREFNEMFLASSMDSGKKNPMLVIWLGGGANGKSVILEFMIKMMGDVTRHGYGYKINSSFLTSPGKQSGGPDTQLMQLKHAFYTYASETNPNDKLYTSRVKEMTSDTISGNEKYGTQENFDVNTRIVLASNYEILVEGNDHGIWRRLFVYWFKVTFKEHPDPKNPLEKPMNPDVLQVWTRDRNYKQAFLSYMVDCYERYRDKYHRNVLKVPRPTIDRETQAYRDRCDLMSKFIRSVLEYVGEVYLETNELTGEEEEIKVEPINLVEVIGRYIDWYKIETGQKDALPAGVIRQQLTKYPELEKYVKEAGNSNVAYLHCHIMHGIAEGKWEPKKKKKDLKADATLDPSQGNLPLTYHPEGEVVNIQESRKRPILVDPEDSEEEEKSRNDNIVDEEHPEPAEESEEDDEMLREIGDAVTNIAEMVFPPAHDDESDELKMLYPEFNKREENEKLLLRANREERKIMMERMNPEDLKKIEQDPLDELDAMTSQQLETQREAALELEPLEEGDLQNALASDLAPIKMSSKPSPRKPKAKVSIFSKAAKASAKASAKPAFGKPAPGKRSRFTSPK